MYDEKLAELLYLDLEMDEDYLVWTDEDEFGLEEFEERRRERITEANEY